MYVYKFCTYFLQIKFEVCLAKYTVTTSRKIQHEKYATSMTLSVFAVSNSARNVSQSSARTRPNLQLWPGAYLVQFRSDDQGLGQIFRQTFCGGECRNFVWKWK